MFLVAASPWDGDGRGTSVQCDPQRAGTEHRTVLVRAAALAPGEENAAFTNLRTALKPGGRIVLLVWQVLENNEWLTELRRALAIGRDLPTPPVGTPDRLVSPTPTTRVICSSRRPTEVLELVQSGSSRGGARREDVARAVWCPGGA